MVLAVDPAVAVDLAPAYLGYHLGIPGIHCLRQSPMDEKAFVEVQVYRGEFLAYD